MKFTEMNMSQCIKQGLDKLGFTDTTEIQQITMPLIQDGVDVVGLSQTGSGKTYAYGIPAIETLDKNLPATQVLVVCPTRELVNQVVDDLKVLVMSDGRIRIASIVGGANMDRQIQNLKRGAKIVVGTPGRLMDHLKRKTLRLDYLKMVVLDEADEMLNMGFKQDIETILKSTKPERQTVMFSATMPPEIQKLTAAFMREPVTIKTQDHECQHTLIKQYFVNCKRTEKVEMLGKIFEKTNPFISIVFCNTKRMTEELTDKLKAQKIHAECLHGDMRQRERSRTMDNFKKHGGILIATDVAARGIDVKNVDIVVNYDFPNNEEYYTHRIGRTGRAGNPGIALTIINTLQQAKALQDLARKLGGKVEEYPDLSTTNYLLDEPAKKQQYKRKGGYNKSRPQARQNQYAGNRNETRSKSPSSTGGYKTNARNQRSSGNRQDVPSKQQRQGNRNPRRTSLF